jgi:hypothetical protein
MPVILGAHEVELEESSSEMGPGRSAILYVKNKLKAKLTRGMAQVLDHCPASRGP